MPELSQIWDIWSYAHSSNLHIFSLSMPLLWKQAAYKQQISETCSISGGKTWVKTNGYVSSQK